MLNLKIALRFLFYRPLKTFVVLTAIVAGSAIFYFILNASGGLKKLVLQLTAETKSHITINGDFDFNNHDELEIQDFRNSLFNEASEITDVSYSYTVSGMQYYMNSKGLENSTTVTIKGMDFDVGTNIHDFGNRIKNRSLNKTPSNDYHEEYIGEAMIGSQMAKLIFRETDIDKVLGQEVTVTYNNVRYKLLIVAYFNSDQFMLSRQTIITTNETVQKITGLQKANVIDIRVSDPMKSTKATEKIKNLVATKYPDASLMDWQEGSQYAVNALYIEDVSIFIIQLFTAISITYGVASILTFNIKEKTNQIGILKAMGVNNNSARNIFLIYSVILTITGIVAGVFLGDFLSKVFMNVFRRPQSNAPLVLLKSGVMNIESLITLLVMGLGNILASLIPIKNAKKLKIIEVIKND